MIGVGEGWGEKPRGIDKQKAEGKRKPFPAEASICMRRIA
jgi:hypothetical protein